MNTVIITGANRGLGLEFARQYSKDDWRVIATCRDLGKAGDLHTLNVKIMQLDVADPASCKAFASQLEGQKIDLLINNAGIMGDNTKTALDADRSEWTDAFNINVLAPALLTNLLVPNLKLSEKPVGATLGSQAGTFSNMTAARNCVYASTKAAAHAVTISLGLALKEEGITYVSLRPGPTKTDMLPVGAMYEADDSVRKMRKVLAAVTPENAGKFMDRTGEEFPLS